MVPTLDGGQASCRRHEAESPPGCKKHHLEHIKQFNATIEQGVKGHNLPAYEVEAGKFYQLEAQQLLKDAERK